jgi:hypothetical protein
VDTRAHIGHSDFVMKAMMCSYLGQFAKQALATFLLFASHIVNHGEPFFTAIIYSRAGGGVTCFFTFDCSLCALLHSCFLTLAFSLSAEGSFACLLRDCDGSR